MCRGGGGGGEGEREEGQGYKLSAKGAHPVLEGERNRYMYIPGSITLLGFHASGMLRTRL